MNGAWMEVTIIYIANCLVGKEVTFVYEKNYNKLSLQYFIEIKKKQTTGKDIWYIYIFFKFCLQVKYN